MSLKRSFILLVAGSAFWVAGVRPAAAAPNCTIQTVSGVAFGAYDVFSASPLDSVGEVRYRCNGAAMVVSVDLSKGNAPTYAQRFMLRAAEQLSYNVYLDALRTSIWGDGTGGTFHYGALNPPNNTWINLTIYGRIPAGQDLSAGIYADTIIATINF